MSISNSDSVNSTANDSSSSHLNSELLLTPPKGTDLLNDITGFTLQQQSLTDQSNSSILFFNDNMSSTNQTSFLPLDNSILRTQTPDLDIDLALGDLNLDDYQDFVSQKGNRSMLNFGSMTPNPQNFQQGFNPSTPNWSLNMNMPQSAPPFNRTGLDHSSSMLLNIKSFKLPDDENVDLETTQASENAQPAGQTHKFGGSLLSTPLSNDKPVDDQHSGFSQMMMGPGFALPNFNGFPPQQYQSQHQLHDQTQMWELQNVDYNGFMMGNQSGVSSMHNSNNTQSHHARQLPPQQYHNQRWNNHGVNVHRNKMNNNRRKGDDPSKYMNTNLEDFKGDIYSLCKDQHGCRFLQKQLEFNDSQKTSLIFEETCMHVIELMVDPFGNYLIQKLLEKCDDRQRTMLVKNASPNFLKISINPHGTRALQKLIECITTEEESLIILKLLRPYIVTLSKDLNGNHVVQKCLARLSQQANQFIFDICCENCVEIATHRHGCCVLQRCLDFGSLEQCKQLGQVLSVNVLPLSFDPFGNYVIQYILNNTELVEANDESITKILHKIHANFIDLSLHKFGSNVIEKILRLPKVNSDLIDLILNKLTIEDFNKLLNDSYGNYVLQTCLDVSNFDKFEKLKKILLPILPSVKNTPHGRRISARLGINLSNLNNGREILLPQVNGNITKVEI